MKDRNRAYKQMGPAEGGEKRDPSLRIGMT